MKRTKIRIEEILFVVGVLIFLCTGLIVRLCLRFVVHFRKNIDPGQYLWLYDILGYISLTLIVLSVFLFMCRCLKNRAKFKDTKENETGTGILFDQQKD
jgi:uncharacterized membrane protein YidH (DUF202 family)